MHNTFVREFSYRRYRGILGLQGYMAAWPVPRVLLRLPHGSFPDASVRFLIASDLIPVGDRPLALGRFDFVSSNQIVHSIEIVGHLMRIASSGVSLQTAASRLA